MKEILMATKNPHKSDRFSYYLSELGVMVVNFADLGIDPEIVEDGGTPEENALKKALAGFIATERPSFGIDYWFEIQGLPKDKQPGPHVRRIFTGEDGGRKEATDEEILRYYSKIVESLGGQTNGFWTSAVALVINKDTVFTERFTRETILTSKICPKTTKGEPLNSMQIDPNTGKYFSEMPKEDWLRLQEERERGYVEFFKKYLYKIS